jgi:hypothetical protein
MSTARVLHTSTYISEYNSVFVAGGSSTYPTATTLISIDEYLPSTGCFQTGINMPRARQYHTANILPAFPDYILFGGGLDVGTILSVADLFNPITGNTLTFALTDTRYAHQSAIFGSSQVVLIGGIDSLGETSTGDAMFSGSTSTFFAVTNTMTEGRLYHTATRLGNDSGVVLICGGENNNYYFYSDCELYYGASNEFISLGTGGTMPTARAYHTATYLPSFDQVLITGGNLDAWVIQNSMILFDVATLSFTTLTSTMSTVRSYHTATLLPNGKVLLVGGSNGVTILNSCDLVDPANNYLRIPAGNINTARYLHTATLIPDNNNGTVLICGGLNVAGTPLNSCELYIV